MQWKNLYVACVSETETDRLEKLLYETEYAMFLRCQELANELRHSNEMREINPASALLEVKVKKLGWPDPLETNNT